MSTTPTNLPVPSEKPQDLKFNAWKIDEFVTSMAQQYIDRFGKAHYTIEGLRWVAQQAISAFGYITLDSFEDGNTLTLPNQVLRLEATGEYYRWDGAFPKVVPTGSTPENSGGIGVGKWLSVGDASLRSNLATNNGSAMIGTSTGQTVEDRFKELEKYRVSSLLSDPNDDAGLAIMN
ncbi:glycosyl hydrolase family 28-related protein, partial [Citrobacter freundii]